MVEVVGNGINVQKPEIISWSVEEKGRAGPGSALKDRFLFRVLGFSGCARLQNMEQSIFDIQKVSRGLRGARLFVVFSGITFFYINLSTRAGVPRKANPYSTYPAGTDLLFDATKLYKSALGNIFDDDDDWGPLDFGIMANHYERQGKAPYSYHSAYMVHLLSNGKMTDPSL